MSIIPANAIKAKLAAGHRVVGTMVAEFRQPAVMQLLANAGFDWCIIDNEHGTFSVESVALLSREARLLGITPIVRVPALTWKMPIDKVSNIVTQVAFPAFSSLQHDDERLRRYFLGLVGAVAWLAFLGWISRDHD